MSIYIYSQSIDVTDKDVLSRLILLKDSSTLILYRNKKSLAKIINNIVKILGEENLIRMTRGIDRTISFCTCKVTN